MDPVRAALILIFLVPSYLIPPHGRADGDQCVTRRAASTVACNIMQASVVGSPVMDLLRVEGSRRCDDRRALLGYSSYDSDNDSEAASIKRFNVKARQVSATIVYMMVLNYVMMPYIGCAGCSQEGGISFSDFHGESGENICIPIRRLPIRRRR